MAWSPLMLLALLPAIGAPAANLPFSPKASASWFAASTTCLPGQTLPSAIRLVMDEGWHSYWLNPGESGMKTRVTWQLPPGWTAGELAHPVPQRFQSGPLPAFGYAGTVWFPVILTAPADFHGTAQLRAKLSWLTCNDHLCIPGDAQLILNLSAGPPAPTPEAAAIRDALAKIPRPQPGRLTVTENPDSLTLVIDPPLSPPLNPSHCLVFPATPHVVAADALIRFTPQGARWSAHVPKSPYAPQPVKHLSLVLAAKDDANAIELSWAAP